jgi:TonB family protein
MMFGTVLLAAHLFAQDTTTPAQSGNTGAADVTSSTSPLQTTNFTGFEVVNRGGGKDLGLYPDQILTVVRAKWNRLISKLEISGRKPGITLLTASIRSDGSLKAVKTVESSGDVALDDAATQAVMRFHFGYSQPGHDVQFCGEHPVSSKKYPSTPSGSGPVNPPSPTFAPDPEYGDQARRAKYQSIVVLGGIVDTDGSFRDLCIRQAAGEGLDEKAIEAASQWKFKPANRGGEPVAVYIEMEVNFRLY